MGVIPSHRQGKRPGEVKGQARSHRVSGKPESWAQAVWLRGLCS